MRFSDSNNRPWGSANVADLVLPASYHRVTKVGNAPKFSEMNRRFGFQIETREVPGFVSLFLDAKKSEGKLDGVEGLEPSNDGIKIR